MRDAAPRWEARVVRVGTKISTLKKSLKKLKGEPSGHEECMIARGRVSDGVSHDGARWNSASRPELTRFSSLAGGGTTAAGSLGLASVGLPMVRVEVKRNDGWGVLIFVGAKIITRWNERSAAGQKRQEREMQ